ncbi:MAG: ribosome recycling factor [Nitrospinales bacterium]
MIDKLLEESGIMMNHSIEHLKQELGKLSTGRASLALLDGLKVDYYGTPTPLSQVATLGVPDSSTITIQPWESSLLKAIEKAIQSSTLGLNPANDGNVIRLNIPLLTGERREQIIKILKKYEEECKVAIRNVRREFNDKIKKLEKEKVPQDDCRKGQEKLQKITDEHINLVSQIAQAKEASIRET